MNTQRKWKQLVHSQLLKWIQKGLVCSAVPLALFASCQTPREAPIQIGDQKRMDLATLKMGVPATVTRRFNENVSPKKAPKGGSSTALTLRSYQQALESAQIDESQKQALASFAACSLQAYQGLPQWRDGRRTTSAYLIPDSKNVACGYANLKDWQFRATLRDPQAATQCAVRLLQSGWSPRSDACQFSLDGQKQAPLATRAVTGENSLH